MFACRRCARRIVCGRPIIICEAAGGVIVSKLRQVLLMIETSSANCRGMLEGIGRYSMAHGRWLLCVKERGLADDSSRLLRTWQGDGIIFRSTDRRTVDAVRRKRVPAVDTKVGVAGHRFPLVYTDDAQIVELAVSHFVERGYQNFGFCAVENPRWVQWRQAAYLRKLEEIGIAPHVLVLENPADESWRRQQRRLAAWAAALPKPIAVLASNDVCATRLIAACRASNVQIPEDVAVVGVDNDHVLCRLTHPPLTSVDPDSSAIGYRAASLLDEMMSGAAAPEEPIKIRPSGIVARQSSDALAVNDAEVVRAMQFIRERVCDGIDVADVARSLCISRVTLERKFAACLKTTPGQAIAQSRTQRVKRFLNETDYTIERIAKFTGYRTQSHLIVAFKRETGLTPGEFRRQAQGR